MRIITKTALLNFWNKHPEAQRAMEAWHQAARNCASRNYSELKQTFSTADYVPAKYTVFDVAGNNYRVVTVIHYNTQMIYIRGVFTHAEYDRWTKENREK